MTSWYLSLRHQCYAPRYARRSQDRMGIMQKALQTPGSSKPAPNQGQKHPRINRNAPHYYCCASRGVLACR